MASARVEKNDSMLAVSTLYVAITSALILAAVAANLSTTFAKATPLDQLRLITCLVESWPPLTTALLCLTYAGVVRSKRYFELFLALMGSAALPIISLWQITGGLNSEAHFYLNSLAMMLQCFFLTRCVVIFLQLGAEWPTKIAIGCGAVFVAFVTAFALAKNWLEYGLSVHYLRILQAGLIILIPPTILAVLFVQDRGLASFQSFYLKVRSRFRKRLENEAELHAAGVILLSAVIITAFEVLYLVNGFPEEWQSWFPLHCLDVWFVGTALYFFNTSHRHYVRQYAQTLSAALTLPSAAKFAMRHLNANQRWAATTGVRTINFVFNHDPDFSVQSALPVSLSTIRNREILQGLTDLLGQNLLHRQIYGSEVMGSIDPEHSTRPAVDLLSAFAVLHLEVFPLVERRISNLAGLLPVLEPSLSEVLNRPGLQRALRTQQCFFHLDYNWIEQQLLHTPERTEYGVFLNQTQASTKVRVYEYLKKRNHLANFIWISDSARARLNQEAPILSSIVQAVPMTLEKEKGEELIFLIRFEDLIPRLQQYFALDQRRNVVKAFEPSAEASRYLNIIQLQANHAHQFGHIRNILNSIANYPWNGFGEKDQALFAIMQLFEIARKLVAKKVHSEKEFAGLRDEFMKAIGQVGYPSRELHLAQIDKYSMRQADSIIQNATQHWHPRFHEAWLLLATIDVHSLTDDDHRALLMFLGEVPKHRVLRRNGFVMGKSVEALANLGVGLTKKEAGDLQNIINQYCLWLLTNQAPLDLIVRFVDAYHFLCSYYGSELAWSEKARETWQKWFVRLSARNDQDPALQALILRFQQQTQNSKIGMAS